MEWRVLYKNMKDGTQEISLYSAAIGAIVAPDGTMTYKNNPAETGVAIAGLQTAQMWLNVVEYINGNVIEATSLGDEQ